MVQVVGDLLEVGFLGIRFSKRMKIALRILRTMVQVVGELLDIGFLGIIFSKRAKRRLIPVSFVSLYSSVSMILSMRRLLLLVAVL